MGNTEEIADAIYTHMHDIAQLGAAVLCGRIHVDSHRIMLTPPTGWAPAEEHDKTRTQSIARGAFKAQGVGIIGRSLQAPHEVDTYREQHFPVFKTALRLLCGRNPDVYTQEAISLIGIDVCRIICRVIETRKKWQRDLCNYKSEKYIWIQVPGHVNSNTME